MSPKLKPLLLPQLVERQPKMDDHHANLEDEQLPYTSYTTNSSSSDIVSPVTPTFSARTHFRGSSSTSSLDLSYTLSSQEAPSPQQPQQQQPQPQLSRKPSKRQLPDVEEEPIERDDDKTEHKPVVHTHLGLYSCLCDQPCDHRKSSDKVFAGDLIMDADFDYDLACLSDGDFSTVDRASRHREMGESALVGLGSRFGSRFNTISRWKSGRKGGPSWSPTPDSGADAVFSRGPSSRSSSISSPHRQIPDPLFEYPLPTPPATSAYTSVDSFESLDDFDVDAEDARRATLEREREKATTPLLPPLMVVPPPLSPPAESPLQSPTIASPTIAPPSATPESHQSPAITPSFSRPSLSTRPSTSSLHHGYSMDPPPPLPAILQEHDAWSDRLGHANFTITPQPYEPETTDPGAVAKFRDDWEAARINYTKHLVRTGENYGQTSKIYGLTEAKWAETEARWKAVHDMVLRQATPPTTRSRGYTTSSRNQSRGRGRGRSGSASAILRGRTANDDFAGAEWRRLEENLPSAVPRMLDAEGKFPSRGDEDIVGPMHRAAAMARSHSEEKYGAKFWKNLAGKVGLRR